MRYLSYEDLKDRGITWSKVHLWRLERQKKFPRRVKLGVSTIAWVEAEVEAWLRGRAAERDRTAA